MIFLLTGSAEIQDSPPKNSIPIEEVGIRHFRYPASIAIDGNEQRSVLDIDVSVGLDPDKKGASISRITDSILEGLESESEYLDFKNVPEIIYVGIAQKIQYSGKVSVHVKSEAFLPRMTKTGKESLVSYGIGSGYSVNTEMQPTKSIEVSFSGMNACPCTMEKTRSMLISDRPEYEAFLRDIPVVTHNQRNIVNIALHGYDFDIKFSDLINSCERVLGLPQLLKYGMDEEGRQIIDSHKNPKFIEDIVREISAEIIKSFPDLPDSVSLNVSSESLETMHPYNLYAKVTMTVGDLRKSLR